MFYKGTISQLPIKSNDRVVGIICKIHSSLDYSNVITTFNNYHLEPICPILRGSYINENFIPDDSYMCHLLEQFFETDITYVLQGFTKIGDTGETYIKNLIDKRNPSKPHTIHVYDVDEKSINNSINHILSNHWCIVFEHESVINDIIYMFDEGGHYDMDTIYHNNREYVIYKGFNKWKNDVNMHDLSEYLNSHFIFPLSSEMGLTKLFYDEPYFMDLFTNYKDMYEHMFDIELKDEYIDTLKLYMTLKQSNMYLHMCKPEYELTYNKNLLEKLNYEYYNIINNL